MMHDPDDALLSASPPIRRLVERQPALRAAVANVLRCAAAVREARARAFPERGFPPDVPSAELVEALQSVADGVAALESAAASDRPDPEVAAREARGLLAAMARLKVAAHSWSEPRQTASPEARNDLLRALSRFRAAFSRLENEASARNVVKLPWQLELASHCDPGAPVSALEVTGYDLPMTPAQRRPWGERCLLSGRAFHTDSHRSPEVRYRSLDACHHVLSPEVHDLAVRLRSALDRLVPVAPGTVELFATGHPWLYDEYLPEGCSASFAKLGLLDFPSQAVALNNMLRTFARRPLLGSRDGRGDFPTVGFADRAALASRGARGCASGYTWDTFDDARGAALRLACGLHGLGLRRGAPLGILSSRNCREFYLADFAAIFEHLPSAGFQDTLSDEQLAAVVETTRPQAIVVDAGSLPRLLVPARAGRFPFLDWLVVFGQEAGEAPPASSGDPRVVRLEALLEREPPPGWASTSGVSPSTGVIFDDAEGHAAAAAEGISPDRDDDVYTIVFTSGSTGLPKGTVMTRRRWVEEMCVDADFWPHVNVSFQPSALAADRASLWRTLYTGGRVGFASRGAGLFGDIRAIRPTLLDVAPAIWNTIYSEYRAAIGDPTMSSAEAAAVRQRFRGYLGGRLVLISTGGAPSDPGVRQTMEEVYGVRMVEGYGTTETGRIAVHGRLVPYLDYRLVDVPELGYLSTDRPHPRGELAVRTPRTTARYWEDEANTASAFTEDGYFLTGDIVELGPDRRVTIIGRRKQFFKLAGSEFVSPEMLEKHYGSSELVESVFVTGLPTREAVAAVVVPSRADVDEATLRLELKAIAFRERLRPCDVPVAVVVEPRVEGGMPWTVDNGLLTPSFKLARPALEARYRQAVEAAYERWESERPAASIPLDAEPGDLESATRLVVRVAASLLSVPPEEVDANRSFADLGGDSLASMELVLALARVFGAKGVDDLWQAEPRDLVEAPLEDVARRVMGRRVERPVAGAAAERRRPGGSATASPTVTPVAADAAPLPVAPADTRAEAVAADADDAPLPDPVAPPATSRGVLLTGATGFLGAHLAAHLAVTLPADVRLHALVRAGSDREARERLAAAFERASLPVPPIAAGLGRNGARLVALAGSLEEERLGLDRLLYDRLQRDVGLVYHVAADTSHGRGYSQLRGPNVVGTRRVLELVTTGTTKALHFVSSLNVAFILEASGARPAYEESPLPGRLSNRVIAANPAYAVSKWVGERMIQRTYAHCRGQWRASISRPALITWASDTGWANDSDWLTSVLLSCVRMGCAIGLPEVGPPSWTRVTEVSARGLDLVPVDFVARSVGRLGRLTESGALPPPTRPSDPDHVPTFHVSNTCPGERGLVTLPYLMDLLAAACLDFEPSPALAVLPQAEWMLRAEVEQAPVAPLLPMLERMSYAFARPQSAWFRSAMAERDGEPAVDCPPVDRGLVEAFVRRALPTRREV